MRRLWPYVELCTTVRPTAARGCRVPWEEEAKGDGEVSRRVGGVEEKDKCQLRMARCGWCLRLPDADLPPPFYLSACLCIDFPDTQPRNSGWTEIKGGPAAEHSREADTAS